MMHSFMWHKLNEDWKYKPGYQVARDQKSQELSIRMRIEMQGYESRQLECLIGRVSEMPHRGDSIDYLMLRKCKIDQAEDEGESCNVTDDGDMSMALNQAL